MSMANTAPSQPPSEAQSRGIYGSCGSPTSNVTHLGRYELKRSPNEEASDRAVKRRRDAEEGDEEGEEEDDEPIAPSDNVKMHRGFTSFSRAGMVTLEKIVIPSRGGSEHRQTSQSRMSASNGGEVAIEPTTDPYLQQFLQTPIPEPHTTNPPRIPSQAQDQLSQTPRHNNKDLIPTSAPTEPSSATDDSLVHTIEARMRAFEDEERAKQHQHEEDLARRRLQQKQQLERELEEKIKRKRCDADVARRAAVQRQEEEYERMMEHLRRR